MAYGICGWIVFGFLVGLVARALMPGEQKMGFVRTTLLGVGGSFVGGLLASLLRGRFGFFHPADFIGAVIGAVILLAVFGRDHSSRRS
jgi:uncharacterized membrane protein YeaQ/YmgE (transglycosylase-associated protein family)